MAEDGTKKLMYWLSVLAQVDMLNALVAASNRNDVLIIEKAPLGEGVLQHLGQVFGFLEAILQNKQVLMII